MTISASSRKETFDGTGSTGPFTVGFRIFDVTDLTLTKLVSGVESTLVLNTDYTATLTALGVSGASVTLTVALAVGEGLTIEAGTPVTQEVRFANLGDFSPENHEIAFDRATAVMQEITTDLSRCIKIPVSDETGTTVLVDTETVRADGVLTFDSDGNVTTSANDFASLAAAAAASAAAAAAAEAAAEAWADVAEAIADGYLTAMTDVTISAPVTGEMLIYDGAEWVNSDSPRVDTIVSMGDTSTSIRMDVNDEITFRAGGVDFLTLTEDFSADIITFNINGFDVDLVAKDNAGDDGFKLDAGTGLFTANKVRTWIKLGSIETVANGDYTFMRSVPEGFTIHNIKTECSGGTCTATFKIDTVALGGAANSVATSPDTQAHASANIAYVNEDVNATISANSSCANMIVWAEIEGSL